MIILDAYDVYVRKHPIFLDVPMNTLLHMTYHTCAINCSDSFARAQRYFYEFVQFVQKKFAFNKTKLINYSMCSAENKINQLQEDFTDKIHHK